MGGDKGNELELICSPKMSLSYHKIFQGELLTTLPFPHKMLQGPNPSWSLISDCHFIIHWVLRLSFYNPLTRIATPQVKIPLFFPTHMINNTVLWINKFLKRAVLLIAPRNCGRSEVVVVADLDDVRGLRGRIVWEALDAYHVACFSEKGQGWSEDQRFDRIQCLSDNMTQDHMTII